MDNLLFHEAPLSAMLDTHREKMQSYVANMSPAQLNTATDDEIVAHVVSEFRIEPLTIHEDRAEAEHAETVVDVSSYWERAVFDRSQQCLVEGNKITVHVPFTGDPELFRYKPSRYNFNPPRGRLKRSGDTGGTVTMSHALPADLDETQFNQWIGQQFKGLHEYVNWSRKNVDGFNKLLERDVRASIVARRQLLERQGDLLKKLSIPLRRRTDAPNPTPLPMPKRVVKPLPPPRKGEPEYGISDQDYEHILKILRHESRSFEATPEALASLGEEHLRDVVLAHLNGHFEGDAAGERFRKKGKTDICIEHENRAAFVAECKLWKGPKALGEAIDQLLGYLTWRDTKAALIVWNKIVKDFAKLQESVPGLLNGHSRFERTAESGHTGEWRGIFRSASDDGREVTVHMFLVDLGGVSKKATA